MVEVYMKLKVMLYESNIYIEFIVEKCNYNPLLVKRLNGCNIKTI